MLPVLEDPTLSSRWGEGTYTITSLLAYSAVGANGLETVPLPGDVTEEQIARHTRGRCDGGLQRQDAPERAVASIARTARGRKERLTP